MKKRKVQKKRSIKRIALKLIWLCFVCTVVFILGAVLAGILFVVFIPNSQDGVIEPSNAVSWITFTGLILTLAMLAFVYASRKTKRTLLRWTRKSLVILIPLVIIGTLLSIIAVNHENNNPQFNNSSGLIGNQGFVEGLTFNEATLLELTNKQRETASTKNLKINTLLNRSAELKCKDMVKNDYWDHNSKEGKEPWQFIDEAGYKYEYAGENLAYGFTSEDDTVKGWMNSEGHKKNILDSNFSEVGFGVCFSDNYIGQGKQLLVVQHFGTPATVSNTSVQGGASPTTNYTPEPYVASVCTKTVIPYETEYIDVDYLYVGETQEYSGWDGYKETCTADSTGYKPSDYTSQPYNKKVYRGTKVKSSGSTGNSPSTGSGSSPSCVPDGSGGYQC